MWNRSLWTSALWRLARQDFRHIMVCMAKVQSVYVWIQPFCVWDCPINVKEPAATQPIWTTYKWGSIFTQCLHFLVPFFPHESQHQTVHLCAARSSDLPGRLNCVTDRSRGPWACQGLRGEAHPLFLPPAVTLSHEGLTSMAGSTSSSSGFTEGRPRATCKPGVDSRKTTRTHW